METINTRDLQHNLKIVLDQIEKGATIEIIRRRKRIARIIPLQQSLPPEPWPDLEKRLNSIYGNRKVTLPTTSETIYRERGNL